MQIAGVSTDLDTRSDIYSLGVVLYELLAARLPYDLKYRSIAEISRVIREVDAHRLSSVRSVYRGDIDTIVSKALGRCDPPPPPSAITMCRR